MLEVSRKRIVKTRRKHECFGCLEMIDKGDAAVHVRGEEDGKHVSFHLHVKCHTTVMKQKLFCLGITKGQLKAAETVSGDFSIDGTSCPF